MSCATCYCHAADCVAWFKAWMDMTSAVEVAESVFVKCVCVCCAVATSADCFTKRERERHTSTARETPVKRKRLLSEATRSHRGGGSTDDQKLPDVSLQQNVHSSPAVPPRCAALGTGSHNPNVSLKHETVRSGRKVRRNNWTGAAG